MPKQKQSLLLLADHFLLLCRYPIVGIVPATEVASNEALEHLHLIVLVHVVVASTNHARNSALSSLHTILIASLLHLKKLLQLLVVILCECVMSAWVCLCCIYESIISR